MVVATNPVTKADIIKPLQFIGEGDRVSTPALYGVTPASSTFVLVGNNIEINPQPDIQHSDTIVLGKEDIIGSVKTMSNYTFSFRWEPIDTAIMAFIIDDTAANGGTGGVGSPDESLSFTWSEDINGTEFFNHVRGFTPSSLTVSLERGKWQAEMAGVAQDITIRSTTDGNTTPTYASAETTSDPRGHLDITATPFTWNSLNFGERRFSMSVTRDIAIQDVNGAPDILFARPSTRNISFSTDVFSGSPAASETALLTDYEDKTARAASYVFSASPSKTFTFANSIITSYNRVAAAGTTDSVIESITARAESITDIG